LAGAELDDAKVGETVFVKRIFLDDGFDFLATKRQRATASRAAESIRRQSNAGINRPPRRT
jgi:hypothetical protein